MRSAVLVLAIAITFAPETASADKAFDDCIRKLCTSTVQSDCWVKGGSAICDEDQLQCAKLPDHAPATVVEKKGKRWLVLTSFAQGWVSDRAMMINGGACAP